jgi:hypothetical protein
MNALRLTSSLMFLLAAAAPVLAGPFDIVKIPKKGIFVQADGCAHQKALDYLASNDMKLVAEVPRTDALYRFVVDFKRDLFAVTISTNNCRLDIVDYARAIEPYCAYIPGLVSSCPNQQLLMQ